jgi:hypothetical protein
MPALRSRWVERVASACFLMYHRALRVGAPIRMPANSMDS